MSITPAKCIEWLDERIKQYGSDADLNLIPAGERHKHSRDVLVAIRAQLVAAQKMAEAVAGVRKLMYDKIWTEQIDVGGGQKVHGCTDSVGELIGETLGDIEDILSHAASDYREAGGQ